ncbi:MAG: DUF4190 domain-containing protein, partial [Acidimicrobiales bacterium]|nr:DUF4190 domain-containing protein [Acidimicrobiales bacterium]
TGIPAIIIGSKARKEIRESGGAQGGDGMALGGVILGWVSTVLSIIGVGIWIIAVVAIGTTATSIDGDINSDPSDGVCNFDRFLQDPDC